MKARDGPVTALRMTAAPLFTVIHSPSAQGLWSSCSLWMSTGQDLEIFFLDLLFFRSISSSCSPGDTG